MERSPLDHPLLLRWTLEAREEALRRDLRTGDRVRHHHRDNGGQVLGESLLRPGMVLVAWDGGDSSAEEPWDLDRDPRSPGAPLGPPVVGLEALLAWAEEKGLKLPAEPPKSGTCRS